jgi:hypothetical protein
MYAEDSVLAEVQAAFHSFIALCARKQLGHQKEYEDQKGRKGGKV